MHVTVTGKNVDVTPAVRDEAVTKLSKVTRQFDRFIEMEVVFSEEANPRIGDRIHCEVVLHAKGKSLRASAAAPDPLTAIDRAQSKLVRQARKHKTKLVSRGRKETAPVPPSAGVPADELEVARLAGRDGADADRG